MPRAGKEAEKSWTVIGFYWNLAGNGETESFADAVEAASPGDAKAKVFAKRGGEDVIDIAGVVAGHVEVYQ